MSDGHPGAPTEAIREVLRIRRDRVGPYVKARHVADELGISVQVVAPRLSALVDAGDLVVWSETPPRTYRIAIDEGDPASSGQEVAGGDRE